MKRKLFDEDEVPTARDRESSTGTAPNFINLVNAGQPRTRVEISRSLRKPTTARCPEVGPSTKSPRTSSCASNSPIGWWPHNRI